MILVDSSVWILALSPRRHIEDVMDADEVVTCPPIVQEVLQGAPNEKRFILIRDLMLRAPMLDAPMSYARYEEAAQLYQRCREASYTIRSSNDCLIAACALAHGATLLHNDRDFDHIAKVTPLQVRRLTPSRS